MKTRFFALALFLFLPRLCPAGVADGSVTGFGRESGLYTSRILDVCQDDYGLLWLGTYDGLYMFDGISFTNFRGNDGDYPETSHLRITKVISDINNDIWCLDNEMSLRRFNPPSRSFEEVKLSAGVRRLIPSGRDEIWAVTVDGGLEHISVSAQDRSLSIGRVPFAGQFPVGPADIVRSADGADYLFSASGIFRMSADGQGASYEAVADSPAYCAVEVDGTIFFGSDEGRIITIDDGGCDSIETGFPYRIDLMEHLADRSCFFVGSLLNHFAVYASDSGLSEILPLERYNGRELESRMDANGNLWLRDLHRGIFFYDPDGMKFTGLDEALGNTPWNSENRITAFFPDSQGNVWFSTINDGLQRLTERKNVFHLKTIAGDGSVSSGNSVRTLFQDSLGRIWASTRDGRLHVYDHMLNYVGDLRSDGTLSPGLGDTGFGVYAMLEDSFGGIWLGTKGSGLIELRDKDLPHGTGVEYQLFRYDDYEDYYGPNAREVYGLYEDDRSRLWIASTDRGLSYVDLSDPERRFICTKNRLSFPSKDQVSLRSVTMDNDGHLYIGGKSGLYVCANADGEPEHFSIGHFRYGQSAGESLDNVNIFDILVTERNDKYISMFGAGMGIISGGGKQFSMITTGDGLLSNFPFYAVQDSTECIWIGSEEGINRLDASFSSITPYPNEVIGLDARLSEGTPVYSAEGMVLFPSYKGILYFNPRDIIQNSFSPKIVFSSISRTSMFGKDRRPGYDEAHNSLMIYSGDRLTVGFLAVDLVNSNQILYSCKLEGRDEDWVALGTSREVTLHHLKKGSYRLLVKSTNGDGIDTGNVSSLDIIVRNPVWRRWYSMCVYALALIVLVVLPVFRKRKDGAAVVPVEEENPYLKGLKGADREFVKGVLDYIGGNIPNGEMRIGDIAAAMNVSQSVLFEKTKNLVGIVPSRLVQTLRLEKAAEMLETGDYTVSEVADRTGFCDSHYFSRTFKNRYGVSPSEYKKSKK